MLDTKAEALVNTVNTVGVMGKGIALQFKEAFQTNYNKYIYACKKGTFNIGDLLVVKDQNVELGEKIIINFPTKKHWKQPSQYTYIEVGLSALARYIRENRIKSIAMPPLGCGNGGLDWAIVKPMIERHLEGIDAEIYLYEPSESVKEILQKQTSAFKAKLTPARAMLLYSLFYYEALGEHSSLFSANKLAYLLQRMGEDLKLSFEAHLYGPYSSGVARVLYTLNGTYLNGLEQNQAKAFEPLKLNYSKFNEIKDYIASNLSALQKNRLNALTEFITGFETELSIEVLASVAFLLDKNPSLTLAEIIADVCWTERKRKLFKQTYIEIAYNHLKNYSASQPVLA